MKNLISGLFILILSLSIFSSCQKQEGLIDSKLELRTETISSQTNQEREFIDLVQIHDEIGENSLHYVTLGESPQLFSFSKNITSFRKLIDESVANKEPLKVYVNSFGEVISIKLLTTENKKKWDENNEKEITNLTIRDKETGESRGFSKSFNSFNSVKSIYNYMQAQSCSNYSQPETYPCITFQYKPDGCYARAHKMKQVLENKFRKTCNKIFAYGFMNSGCGSNKGWIFHVAPLVYVGNTAYVIDPSLKNVYSPLTVRQWKDKLAEGSKYFVCRTYIKSGNYYKPKKAYRCGASGYYGDSSTYNHTNYTLLRYEDKGMCY